MWNLDTLQSPIRAGLIALDGLLWGIRHRAPAAPASPPPHQLPLLLLLGLLVAAGCARFDTRNFRAARTNPASPDLSHLQARNDQACAAAGQDRQGQHRVVYPDGRFGCVIYPGPEGRPHRQEIWRLAGERTESRRPPLVLKFTVKTKTETKG